jgi:hypothetical protein
MKVLDVHAMSDNALDSTAHALDGALPPLASLAIAAGAAPDVVKRTTGCNVTNTSRVKKQTFNHLVARLDRALFATGCLPLLDVRVDPSALTTDVIGPTVRESFVGELIQMADALQHMKYVLLVELDTRTTVRSSDIATTIDWDETVGPHVMEWDRLSKHIVDQARTFERARARYVQLSNIGQVPWSSRQPIKNELFVTKHVIADLLEMLSESARSAATEASQFECRFDLRRIRRHVSAWKSHAERTWDHRVMVKSDKMFRRTLPLHHPLVDDLRPKLELAQTRLRWQSDYQRALPMLEVFVNLARSCADDAIAARMALVNNRTHLGSEDRTLTVDLGNGRVLTVHPAGFTSDEPPPLRDVPRIMITAV